MSIDRSKRASALAKYSQWPFLAVDQKVLDRVERGVDDVHPQAVGELAGIAQERLERMGPA